ncbi:hypothetical protein OG462_03600 [Streptomyces sp. NBC_01077]|uniref:hypothetical protein n=1 Tax=Streptomyces sp. NBC_01077 TaxID=2903746 RepID=UPI00386396B6|nr:hypothetical protein OG462_03600 [Streptomyces sp. NBC_01077]
MHRRNAALPAGIDTAYLAESCWVLTGPHLFTQLTTGRGWNADTHENGLAGTLAAPS